MAYCPMPPVAPTTSTSCPAPAAASPGAALPNTSGAAMAVCARGARVRAREGAGEDHVLRVCGRESE
jgi:hypothetical protein